MAYNVLVVDDSSITRKVIGRIISMVGLDLGELHEAADGIEALKILDEEWIDLVFSDLSMPRMNGIEFIDKMAENSVLDGTPVIVITSDRNELRLAELKNKGVRAHINKPFRPEVLRDVLIEVLGAQAIGETNEA